MTHTLLCASLLAASASAPAPSSAELEARSAWAAAAFDGASALPVSFTYGGRSSRELLPGWTVERSRREVADARHGTRVAHTVAFRDPATGLTLRIEALEYQDFPTVEWTAYFRNDGAADTPILEGIRACDVRLALASDEVCALHTVRGDNCTERSYEPLDWPLALGETRHVACTGGRPTQEAMPYFRVEAGAGGLLCGLGWPGQWEMEFARDAAGLTIRGGQEGTHFTLHPGEEVRTPLVVLQFTGGDALRAQNLWRRWMLAHNLPWPGGKPVEPFRSLCCGNVYPGLMTVGETELGFLRKHVGEGVNFDFWWQDAGWYPCDPDGWPKTGTWEPDPVRFPGGLRELSDYVHAQGRKTLLWFEPERVAAGTWITLHHPEWVHGGADGGLLDLGNAECRTWLTDHIDRVLVEQGIDLYRQDFNIDPLPYWRAADAPDRQGITEIRHVEGYLAYWDALLARHPGMLIDSCASGGRRNDLETLRRAVPLLRSDWYNGPEGQQCLTYGLSIWVPFQGTGTLYLPDRDANWWRSSMPAEMSFGPLTGLDGADWELIRKMVDEHKRVAPCFLGDFYPLTPYSLATDAWMVFQFDRADEGRGVIQAFRRSASPFEAARWALRGLDPEATYVLTNLDTGAVETASGQALSEPGLRIDIASPGTSAVIEYRRE